MDPLTGLRVIVALGLVNAVSGLVIFFSCRCVPGWRVGKWLMKHKSFKKFYRYHCYVWYLFWASVIAHAVLAYLVLGWPF